MDNFKAVYKILSTLEKAMDLPEFDIALINADSLGVSQERWLNDPPKMVYRSTKLLQFEYYQTLSRKLSYWKIMLKIGMGIIRYMHILLVI